MGLRHSDLERRVAALERQGRYWKIFGFGCTMALLLWMCYPGGAVPDEIRARSFALIDAEGRAYAELKMTDEGPGLYLLDSVGVARVSLVHSQEETALYLRDADDQVRVGVAQFAHGGGGVALHGAAAKGAAVLYFKGEGSLTFYDSEGNVIERSPGSR